MIIQSIAITGICVIVIGLVIAVAVLNKKCNASIDAMADLFFIMNQVGIQTNKLTKEVLPDDTYEYELSYTDKDGNKVVIDNLEEWFNENK